MGYKYSIAQLQDYYYTTWSNKFKFDQSEAERKHRYVKRSAALKEKKMKKLIALRQSQRLQSAQNSSNQSNSTILIDCKNGPGIEDDVIEDDEDVTLSNAPENIDESEHGDQVVDIDTGDIDEDDTDEEENGMEGMCFEEDDGSYSDDQSVEDELNCEPNCDDDDDAN